MAKEKLFTPEDFDKPKDKSFWQKYKKWIIGIVVVLVIVVLCCIFCGKKEESNKLNQSEQTTQVEDTNTTAEIETQESSVKKEVNESAETETLETGKTSTPEVETPNKDLAQEDVKPQMSTLPTNISDNIEQEALNVIRGDYGNVPERRERLGSKYQEIQNRVNQLKREGAF